MIYNEHVANSHMTSEFYMASYMAYNLLTLISGRCRTLVMTSGETISRGWVSGKVPRFDDTFTGKRDQMRSWGDFAEPNQTRVDEFGVPPK